MQRLRDASRLTAGAVIVWGLFAAVIGARNVGLVAPSQLAVTCAVSASLVAAACAVGAVVSIWRGPRIVDFTRDDAVLCPPAAAEVVRGAAQVRGTMGGAGHVYRWRMLVVAVAWTLAAAFALDASLDADGAPHASPLLLLVPYSLAVLARSRPFYYREVNGGSILLSPPSTLEHLRIRAIQTAEPGVLSPR